MIGIILIIFALFFFVFLAIVGYSIGMYNTFRVGQQDIQTQFSNIKTEYQRRVDMFFNLVQAVKSYKNFEKETYVQVAAARTGLSSGSKVEQMKKMNQLNQLFQKLMVVIERYPNLKANEQHNKLMDEVRITEDRINVARTDYNEIVGDYNKLVQMFPSNIVAGLFRFRTESFFVNEEGTDKAPKIDLN